MKKPEVIILHGWAISPENEQKWQTFRDKLQALHVTSTFLPIPGLDTKATKPWNLQQYVEWLAEVLKDKQEVILLGHSFGGQLAVRFTAEYPEKVSRLILVASAGIRDNSLKARLKRSIFYVLAKVGKVFFRHPFFKKMLYKLAREHDYEQASSVMKQTMQLVTQDEIRADLPRIKVPVQLIWGKQDTSTPYRNTQLILDAIPTANLCTISDARHSPQFTHPEHTASCVAEFLSEEK